MKDHSYETCCRRVKVNDLYFYTRITLLSLITLNGFPVIGGTCKYGLYLCFVILYTIHLNECFENYYN